MATTIDVVWSFRDSAWYVRPPSRPGEWVRLAGHHTGDATDPELSKAAFGMAAPEDARNAVMRKLPPAWRLPRET